MRAPLPGRLAPTHRPGGIDMHGHPLTALGQFSGGAGLPAGAVTVAFAALPGSLGWPPSPLDVRQMAVRFNDTGTLVAHHVPVEHLPAPHPGDGPAFWAELARRPEALPALMQALAPGCLPRHWRALAATSGWLTLDSVPDEPLRLHWQPCCCVPGPTWDEALKLDGADPDHAHADLRRALARGERPRWTLWLGRRGQVPKPIGELTLHAITSAAQPLPATTDLPHLRPCAAPAGPGPHALAAAHWHALGAPARAGLVAQWARVLARLPEPQATPWLARLHAVDDTLASGVARLLGLPLPAAEPQQPGAAPAAPAAPFPAAQTPTRQPLTGRAIAMFTGPDTDADALAAWLGTLAQAGAELRVIPHALALANCPVTGCDALVLALSETDALHWTQRPEALDAVRDAFVHGKAIAATHGARLLLSRAGVERDAGVMPLDARFVAAAARRWER